MQYFLLSGGGDTRLLRPIWDQVANLPILNRLSVIEFCFACEFADFGVMRINYIRDVCLKIYLRNEDIKLGFVASLFHSRIVDRHRCCTCTSLFYLLGQSKRDRDSAFVPTVRIITIYNKNAIR